MVDTVKVTLAKKEVTYGTDPTPTPAANAILTRNFSAQPIVVDNLDRNLDLPSRGRSRSANTNRRSQFGFEVEMAGSGDAGTAPRWMMLLEACGAQAPVLTADTDAVQNMAAPGVALSSLTSYHWTGPERTVALGCRGNFGLNFSSGAYPFATFSFLGLLPAPPTAPVTATAPGTAADLDAWIEPVEVNTANTDFSLGGYAAVLQQLTIESGNQPSPRNLVGQNEIILPSHAFTGRAVIKAPALGSKNYYSNLNVGDEIAMQLIHGTVAGNIVQLDADYLQVLTIERSELDDELMLNITFGLNVHDGSDDLTLTAK